MATNTSTRLLRLLRSLGLDVPEGSRVVRLNGTKDHRHEGLWSWSVFGPDDTDLGIGSEYAMVKLLSVSQVTTEKLGDDIVLVPVRNMAGRARKPMKVMLEPVEYEGVQTLKLRVDYAPDITPEYSTVQYGFRAERAVLRYVRSTVESPWKLSDIRVIGRRTRKDLGVGAVLGNSQAYISTTYTDLTGTNGLQRGKTPPWVIELAQQYADADTIPPVQ